MTRSNLIQFVEKICLLILTQLLVFVFCLSVGGSHAQERESVPVTQQIGLSLQRTPGTSIQEGNHSNQMTYNFPGYLLFYKLLFAQRKSSHVAAEGGFMYRSGHGYESTWASGGGTSYSGNFELIKYYVGLTQFFNLGTKGGFSFGVGLCLYSLIYASGELVREDWSISTSTNSISYQSANTVLYPIGASLHIELDKRFKLRNGRTISVGLKQYLETSDGFYSRRNLTNGVFVAFQFRCCLLLLRVW